MAAGGCGKCSDAPVPADVGVAKAGPDVRAYVPPRRPPLAAPTRILARPRNQFELPTTDWAIYLTNVRGQLRTTRAAYAKRAPNVSARRQLGWRVYTWAEIHGDPELYQEVVDVATDGLAVKPVAEMLMLRAEAQFGLGRAREALADLDAAEALHAGDRRIASLRAEAQWHLKQDTVSEQAMRAELAAHPGVHILGRVAQMEWALGNLDEAERLFATAETKITNTAPVPVAWLSVQRGLIHLEARRTDKALVFLRAAHERAPGYPAAVVGLARAETAAGSGRRAVELLEPVVAAWPRPSHHLALSEAYAAAGSDQDADRSFEAAVASCEALFPRFPEAVAAACADVHLARQQRGRAMPYAMAAVDASPSRRNRARVRRATIRYRGAQAPDAGAQDP